MLKRNIVSLEGEFDSSDNEGTNVHVLEVSIASDKVRRSFRHDLLRSAVEAEPKRPRPSYGMSFKTICEHM